MNEEEFDWPCWRRDAHKRHEVKDTTLLTDEQLTGLILTDDFTQECPGVRAHPSVMIGRVAS